MPTSACTSSANTGTCVLHIYYSSTSGSGGTTYAVASSQNALAAGKVGSVDTTIQNLTASSQIYDSSYVQSIAVPQTVFVGAVNTANASYLNFFLTNSVSADNCFIDSAIVDSLVQ